VNGRSQTCRAAANDQDIKFALLDYVLATHHLVFISMPGRHNTWHVRQKGLPSTTARHSKQIPIPHNGPRNSPLTDFRQVSPANAIATATVAPVGTETEVPFTLISSRSGQIFSGTDVLR
jgi:hypothetical protein